MSVQVEKLEKNMAKLTIEVSAEEFEAAIEKAYQKEKGKIALPGFRKGKAPRKMIEKMYGAGVFYEDAANMVIPEAYDKALKECEEEIVSRPSIDVTQIEAGKPFIFTAEVALKPEVTLGEYKGVEIPKKEIQVTEEEVQAAIDKERDSNSRTIDVDDRPVENGDMIKLDFDGSVDGVPFEGGKSSNYPLTIGSASFIPGFEEQLIGAKIGEELDVNVTFPEDYHAEELQGKEAVFKCKVNEIKVKELPDADDDFAQDVSEFDTLEEYKADLRKKLEEAKMKSAAAQNENNVIAKVCENAQIDIPAPMIEMQTEQMIDDYARRMQSQGLPLDQYMQYTGMTMDKLKDQFRPQAERNLKTRLVLEEVAKAENIQVSEEAVDAEIKKMAEAYKIEPEKMKEYLGDAEKENITMDLKVQEAVDFLVAEAKLV